jgi:diguanylate cyclase (GGDEF)-like protein
LLMTEDNKTNEASPIDLVPVSNTALARAPSTLIARGLELALHLKALAAHGQSNAADRRAVVCVNDTALLNLLRIQLTMHGYQVVQARCSPEIITLCKSDNFHLIVTDLDTNALAAAKEIHYEDPTIPAITTRFAGRGLLFQNAPFSISPWDQPLSLLHRKIAPIELRDLESIAGHHFDVLVWHVWSEQYIDSWSSKVMDELGESARAYLKIVHEEVSKIKRNLNQMRTVLHVDALTGVCNRTFFEMRFAVELERAKRSNLPTSLILADVDLFDSLKEKFGQDMANEVLRSVSMVLKQQIRKMDVLCRYSDSDFAIIVPETNADTTQRVAEMLCRTVETRDFPVIPQSVTISCGVVAYPTHGTTGEELISAAEGALSYAKALGRNHVFRAKP